MILMPGVTQDGAVGETCGEAAAGRWDEGTMDGRASRADCGLFSSGLRHITHLHAANSEAAELGYRWTSRRKREDSTGDRRCKGERTIPGVGSFQRAVRFHQMVRRLGFVELVDLGRETKIALPQTIDLVRPGRDLDFSPGKKDIWVVPLLLRKLAYAVYELEGFAKVGKLEGLRDVVLLNYIPSVHLLLQRGEFLTLERRHSSSARDACFGH